ncbi:MAG TPA: type 1 glutamine amidotransferase [Nitrososphaeria archaeon]|nr:MAG: protease [Nitrososphaerota archaeon]HDJ66515.1 type 1 glutamine amidotransferase [Nitrososphaeria archaeon]
MLVKRVGPSERLKGRRVAIIAANEFEDIELLYPLIRLSEEGAEVAIVPIMRGSHPRPVVQGKPVTGRYGTPIPFGFLREGERHVIMKLDEIDSREFDALIIPGGFSPDRLRAIPEVLKLVKEFYERGKLIAAICHGPQVLISAGIVKDKRVTCYAAVKDDLINAGAIYVDEPAVKDGNIITARVPDDLPEFCRLIIDSLSS